jgi:hypothetical protein
MMGSPVAGARTPGAGEGPTGGQAGQGTNPRSLFAKRQLRRNSLDEQGTPIGGCACCVRVGNPLLASPVRLLAANPVVIRCAALLCVFVCMNEPSSRP